MMRLAAITATALASLSFATGCQQQRGDVADRLVIGEVMMHAEFSANLRALAMPGGRLTGTPNAEHAQQFVADKLRTYGLRNVRFEPYDMSCWTVRSTEVTLLTEPPRAVAGAVALARTLPTPPGGITAELVDLGEVKDAAAFTERGPDLRGKFVLVRDGGLPRGEKMQYALEQGAAGLVVMSPPDHEPIIGNGHHTPRPEPGVVIRHDEELIARLAQGESLRLNIQLDTENWDCRPNNVVGEIPGHGPQAREVIILCAHLDSWHLAEGAIDNGIGSATILETARALTHIGWQPRRTVRFIWFMGEELGLTGSTAYVRQHEQELDDIVAVINCDMPGSPRMFGVYGHPELKTFVQDVQADLAGYELQDKIEDWSGDGSDHAPFTEHGVAALALGGELGPGVKNYHTTGDKFEAVDRRGTIPSAAVLGVVLRRLADMPQRPTLRGDASTHQG
jgi:carboxypeptidase Q